MRPLRALVADIVSPVTPPLTPEPPQASKPELFPCDNAACCALLAWGVLKCPWCGGSQQRVQPAGVRAARPTDEEILSSLDPDNPYDWQVHGL